MDCEPHHAAPFSAGARATSCARGRRELIETLLPRLAIDLGILPPADLATLFPVPVDEVRLEIGFGGGENMIAQAKAQPRTGFIGVEPFVNGMAKALAAIETAGCAISACTSTTPSTLIAWLPDASLARIDLIHPDPWPKRRHWKRRFVQDATGRAVRPDFAARRRVRFVTDIADYAAWTLQRFVRSPRFRLDRAVRRRLAQSRGRISPARAITPRPRASSARPCFLIFRRRVIRGASGADSACRTCQKRTTRCAVDAESRP